MSFATNVEWRDKLEVESEEHLTWLRTLVSKRTGTGKGVKATFTNNPFQLKLPDELDEAYVALMVKFAEHTILSNYKMGKKKEKKTRPPTAYNLFMKDKMNQLKIEQPDMTAKERFSSAAELWSTEKQNVELETANVASTSGKAKKTKKTKATKATTSESESTA